MCYPPQDYVGTIPGLHAPTHGVAGVDPVALDASQTNTGRFGLARMPDAAAGNFLEGGGVGLNPVYNALVAGDIPNLDTSKITTGRFGMPRMPDGALGNVLTAQGLGADPAYAAPPAVADTRSRTIVVAASNSIDPTLAPAAYRCDGVADQVEINAAITALGAVGGTVILLEGTYNLTGSINLATGTALMGQGRGTVIAIPGVAVGINMISAVGVNRVLVSDLRVDGSGGTAGTQHGIYFSTVTHSKITRCWVENMRNRGIYLLTTSDNNIIAGNSCISCTDGGIYVSASSYDQIVGNNCQSNTSNGIHIMGGGGYHMIVGNNCQGNTVNGIYITGTGNNEVVGNNCRSSVTGSGIYLYNAASNNTIVGNGCQGNVYGIRLATDCVDNTVAGNYCKENSYHGIQISDTSNNNTVTGNSIRANSRHGIWLYAASRNSIVGNILHRNSQGADNTYNEIFLEGTSTYNVVDGNSIHCDGPMNNSAYGIREAAAADDYNMIVGNIAQGAVTANVSRQGPNSIEVHNIGGTP